ncbi:MAG TPA: ABC transporter ATP-binding protein [Solirubrobacteraceae bacterium]|jgi:ATP-binding cassette subfamily B protein
MPQSGAPRGGIALLRVLLAPYRRRVMLAITATLLSTAAKLIPPYLAGRVIDDVVNTGSTRTLVLIAIALGVTIAVAWLAETAETWLVGDVGQRALMDLRFRLVEHLQTVSMRYYDHASAGRVMSRVTNDVEALNNVVNGGLNQLVSNVLLVVGTVVVLLVLDWRMALVAAFVFPLVVIVAALFQRAARPAWRKASDALAQMTTYMAEGLSGRAVVRAFGQEERHLAQFERHNAETRMQLMRSNSLWRTLLPLVELIIAVTVAAVLVYGAREAVGGALQVGLIVSFTAYLRQALAPLPQLTMQVGDFQQAATALEKLDEILAEPPDPGQLPGRRPAPTLRGDLAFEDVRFAYEDERWIIHDINVCIEAGQTVAFIGHSGSGKSTLIKLAVGFYGPQRGCVRYDGVDLAQLDLASVRRQVALVTQEPFLFAGSVAHNIAWARPGANVEDVRAAAEAVDALEVFERLPNGLDTEVGERGERLSGGQRQLVSLARAIIIDPRMLVLDEATSSIDVATETRVQRGLARLLAGRTSLVVAHRLSTIRGADRVVVLEAGHVVEQGSPAELRATGGHFAQLEAESERVA